LVDPPSHVARAALRPHEFGVVVRVQDHPAASRSVSSRAVEVLLQRSPQSVHVDRRVNEWLDWDRARADELSARDSVFARLEAAARDAQSRSRDHPDWTRARRVLRDSVVSKDAYREAMGRLTAAMKATPRCG